MLSSGQIIDFLVSEFAKAAPAVEPDSIRGALQRLVTVACTEQVQRIQEDVEKVDAIYHRSRLQ